MQVARWFPSLVTSGGEEDDADGVDVDVGGAGEEEAAAAATAAPTAAERATALTVDSNQPVTSDQVDISLDQLLLPDVHDAVNSHIHRALHDWNRFDHAAMDQMLAPRERKLKYRRLLRWLLYQQHQEEDQEDQEEEVAMPTADRRRHQQEATANRRLRRVVRNMPSIHQLRQERRPSARVETFLRANPVSARVQMKSRSAQHTTTFGCFEFATTRAEQTAWIQQHTTQDQDDNSSVDPVEDQQQVPPRQHHRQQQLEFTSANSENNSHSFSKADILLLVEVRHPSLHPKRTQWFLVLASQLLTELVDAIVCSMDLRLEQAGHTSKLLFLGSRFFMDARHRVDQQQDDRNSIDLSEPIRRWLKQKPSRLDHWQMQQSIDLPTLRMETTRFADVSVELDAANLFVHQGECEHVWFFRDVRLRHALDTRDDVKFPLRLLQDEDPSASNPRLLRNCLICQHFSAKFVCFGDQMSVADPMFFCERCYQMAHYDQNGSLLFSDFKAFPYFQD